MQSLIGQTIGAYLIVEQLGQGGMATVYKASQARLNRFVALKMIHGAYLTDSQFIMRFEREATVAASLEHPNIVPVYDYSEHQGHPYLVMKLIDGTSLKEWMVSNSPTPQNLRRVLRPLARALDYAHGKGVLHRDIKPSNIMLDSNGTPYITDFGLARLASAPDSTMSKNMMIGTPAYMSPEQAQGEILLDRRSDLYAFAVMAYEMLTGDVPFNATTPHTVVHDHIYTPLPVPSSRNPALSSAVDAVFLQALSKDPSDRYESAAAFVLALESALGSATAGAPAAPVTASKAQKPAAQTRNLAATRELPPEAAPAKRRSLDTVLLGVLAVVVVLLIIGLVVLNRRNQNLIAAAATILATQTTVAEAPPPDATHTTDPRPTLPEPFTATPPLPTQIQPAARSPQPPPPSGQAASPQVNQGGGPPVGSGPGGMEFLLDVPEMGILAARSNLDAYPDSPEAHLALAWALLENGNVALALGVLADGETNLQTIQVRASYWGTAAHLAYLEGNNAASYWLYSYALSIGEGVPGIDMPLRSGAGLDLYTAAQEPNAFAGLRAPSLATIFRDNPPPVMRAILARSYITDGEFGLAEAELAAARRDSPQLAEATLAEAELEIARENWARARELLTRAPGQGGPRWIQSTAGRLLETMGN
ncbi:MAG: serine/threonine protein kinase [Pleurocapsa minor GSE-CHR-MK-17-07R]|jgi:hypothetical protein|nr:serine/threonine protein kinase [Pleurocapsa minor GSE-CHR-MK 17-07R]